MAEQKKPKVLLFDIGGVCVKSPFQAILDYELSLGIPPGWVNYSISRTSPTGYWHKIERGDIPLDESFFRGFSADLHDSARWAVFYQQARVKDSSLPAQTPPLPSIDAKSLFDEMMTVSKNPDLWMFPALQNLKASGKYILAALSNTIVFPPGHKLHIEDYYDDPVRKIFDIFISSAHVGIRKPDPKMYQLALSRVNQFAKENASLPRAAGLGWDEGVEPRDIVFLDDIGENLKGARNQGFRTIKVNLGRTFEAVDELERVTGMKLSGNHPRIPIQPNYKGSKAKI